MIKNNLIVDLENVVGQTWKYCIDSIQCQDNLCMKIFSFLIGMVHCISHDAVEWAHYKLAILHAEKMKYLNNTAWELHFIWAHL